MKSFFASPLWYQTLSMKFKKTAIFSCHRQVLLERVVVRVAANEHTSTWCKDFFFFSTFVRVGQEKKLSSTCATFEFQNRIKKTRKVSRRQSRVSQREKSPFQSPGALEIGAEQTSWKQQWCQKRVYTKRKEFSPYRKENTTLHHYKDQLVNAVYENNRCLQWESYETHKYKMKSYWLLKQVGYIVTIGL
jgi:hypothetical protein